MATEYEKDKWIESNEVHLQQPPIKAGHTDFSNVLDYSGGTLPVWATTSGDIAQPRGGERWKREENTREKVLSITRQWEVAYPNQAVNLSEIARQTGKSRERIRQIYNELTRQEVLPAKRAYISSQLKSPLTEQVRQLKSDRFTAQQIADKLHVNKRRVSSISDKLCRAGEHFPRGLSARERELLSLGEQVKQLREQGLGVKRIVEVLGQPPSTVRRRIYLLINARELDLMRAKRRSAEEINQADKSIAALRNTGKTNQEIAIELGMALHLIDESSKRLLRQGLIAGRRTGSVKGF